MFKRASCLSSSGSLLVTAYVSQTLFAILCTVTIEPTIPIIQCIVRKRPHLLRREVKLDSNRIFKIQYPITTLSHWLRQNRATSGQITFIMVVRTYIFLSMPSLSIAGRSSPPATSSNELYPICLVAQCVVFLVPIDILGMDRCQFV